MVAVAALMKEFTSKAFKDLLQEFGINHYESEVQDFAKNAIVERYNRTLRRIMEVDKAKREPRPFTEADIARYVKNITTIYTQQLSPDRSMCMSTETKPPSHTDFAPWQMLRL